MLERNRDKISPSNSKGIAQEREDTADVKASARSDDPASTFATTDCSSGASLDHQSFPDPDVSFDGQSSAEDCGKV
jgi:hypothetical protein